MTHASASPPPTPIAQMPAFFFWARTDTLGFPPDFARQIDDGTLPKIYHDALHQRLLAASSWLDAIPTGRPS